MKASPLFSFSQGFFNSLPSGGSPSFTIEGGETFGTHTVNLEQTMGPGLQVLNSVLLLIFAFLSIRVIILKR